MARAPYRLPIPLVGGGDSALGISGAEVHPIAQWVEPARSGAAVPATGVPLTMPGVYYGTTDASGVASRLWLRREVGDESFALVATVFLNGDNTGEYVTVPAGETQAQESISVAIAPGDEVRVYITGGDNTASVSGMLATPTRLFRLLPAPIGLLWVMDGGTWVAPATAYPKVSGTYEEAEDGYAVEGGIWTEIL